MDSSHARAPVPAASATASSPESGSGAPGADALTEAMAEIYGELRRLARRQLSRFGSSPTLSTTALVHEAYLKLRGLRTGWHDRRHLLALGARAMRQVIVDYARERRAQKRGGGQAPLQLESDLAAADCEAARVLELNDALSRLATIEVRLVRVVECRFFGGLSEEETAEALDVSVRTVQRDWSRAREWLRDALGC